MNRSINNGACKRDSGFVPAWFKRERSIRVVTDSYSRIFKDKGVITVDLSSVCDFHIVSNQAAFLFGSSSRDLFVRASFGCFIKIKLNNNDKVAKLREELYASEFGALIESCDIFSDNVKLSIPVYHDALEMIPQPIEEKTPRGVHSGVYRPPFRP